MKKSELKMIIKEVLEESRLYQEDTEEAGEVESPEEEADEEGLKEQIKEYFLNAEDLNDEAYHTFLTDELGIEPDVGEGLAYEILKELLVKESEEGDEPPAALGHPRAVRQRGRAGFSPPLSGLLKDLRVQDPPGRNVPALREALHIPLPLSAAGPTNGRSGPALRG